MRAASPRNRSGGNKKPPKLYPSPEAAIADIVTWPAFKGSRHAGSWMYRNSTNAVAFIVARFDFSNQDKQFRPIRPVGDRWALGDPPGKLPLYRLPDLAKSEGRVFAVEGEKCVEVARQLGLAATTSAHGSRSAAKTDWSPLAGREVILLPDADDPGRAYAESVAGLLLQLDPPATVKVVDLPGLPEGGDIVDYVGAKESVDSDDIRRGIDELADKTPVWEPKPSDSAVAGQNPVIRPALPWRPFPTEVLPQPLRDFTIEGARALGVDDSFVALPCLASCAAAIGTTRRIRLRPEWAEPSVLWTVIVAQSGRIKSPPLDLALAPIRRIDDAAFETHKTALADYKQSYAAFEAALNDWKRGGHKRGDARPEEPEKPVRERFTIADVTIESVAARLEDNPRGLLLARDELATWIGAFDAYRNGRGTDMANWCFLYGARTLTVDRKTGTRPTIRIRHAACSVTGTIQPRTLARMLTLEFFESGFAARLLMVMPPSTKERWIDESVSAGTKGLYAKVIRRLLDLQHTADPDGQPGTLDLGLTDEAKAVFIRFYNEFAQERENIADDDLRAAHKKLEGAAARFALTFQLVRWAAGDADDVAVDQTSIRAGVTLARWFYHETERIYATLRETEAQETNRQLVESITGRGGVITPRELSRAGRRYQPVALARAALDGLVKAGMGRWEHPKPGPQGGRPTEVFRLISDHAVDETLDTGAPAGV